MFTFLMILMIIISVLLILVVLIQPGKGDMVTGMGTIGGSISSMFGTRQAMNLLTKITIILAVSLMVLALLTNKFFIYQPGEAIVKPVTEGVAVPTQKNIPLPVQQNIPPPAPENKSK